VDDAGRVAEWRSGKSGRRGEWGHDAVPGGSKQMAHPCGR